MNNKNCNIVIEKENGICFSAKDGDLLIQVEAGSAEILGAELNANEVYTFTSGSKVYIFSWFGCTLSTGGGFTAEHFSSNSTIGRYLSIHNGLNQMRESSRLTQDRGPRIMVVGASDMGKSSLCKVLCNYASRSGWKPMFVDLDLGQNELSLPGTIGATLIDRQLDLNEGYTSNPFKISHFGYKTPDKNGCFYKFIINKMAESVNYLQSQDHMSNFSGIIINTCGWVEGLGYQTIMTAAKAFEVDVVVVIGDVFLHLNISKELPSFVKVIMQPKPIEVSPRTQEMRIRKRDSVVRNYFYGVHGLSKSSQLQIHFKDIGVFKIINHKDKYETKRENKKLKRFTLLPVDIGVNLEGLVTSASHYSPMDVNILHENVYTFVVMSVV